MGIAGRLDLAEVCPPGSSCAGCHWRLVRQCEPRMALAVSTPSAHEKRIRQSVEAGGNGETACGEGRVVFPLAPRSRPIVTVLRGKFSNRQIAELIVDAAVTGDFRRSFSAYLVSHGGGPKIDQYVQVRKSMVSDGMRQAAAGAEMYIRGLASITAAGEAVLLAHDLAEGDAQPLDALAAARIPGMMRQLQIPGRGRRIMNLGAIGRSSGVTRPFTRLVDDIDANPSKWKAISAHTEKATRKGARRHGASTQTIYRNTETGETIVHHTVTDDLGRVVDDHWRPNYKPRVGDVFDGQ